MSATPTQKGAIGVLTEAADSPTIVRGVRTSITRTYVGIYSVCAAATWYKGDAGSGAEAGFQVASCTITKERGNHGKVVVVWESGGSGSGQPLPLDEVAISPSNQNPRTARHPLYSSLTAADLQNVEDACLKQSATERAAAYAALGATGQQLVDKIRLGNESYYLAALRYSWATHSYSIPTTTRGGYTESISGTPLSGYFVAGISWLREADDLQYSNGIWRRTRSWLGAADGHWDADLYA